MTSAQMTPRNGPVSSACLILISSLPHAVVMDCLIAVPCLTGTEKEKEGGNESEVLSRLLVPRKLGC